MHYNVAQLLKEPLGSQRTYDIDEPVSINGASACVLPGGKVSLMRTDKGILISASVKTRMLASCSRCLKSFSQHLDVAVEEEYLPTLDINTGQSIHLPEGSEDSFTIDQLHVLDLTEALRQYTITGQFMKPLCREACGGLCPICGVDRNESLCSCEEEAVAPRWMPLRKLLKNNSRLPRIYKGI